MSLYVNHVEALDNSAGYAHYRRTLGTAKPCLFPNRRGTSSIALPSRSGLRSIEKQLGRGAELRALCAAYEVTMPSLAYAAWALVLQYATGGQARDSTPLFGYLANARHTVPSTRNLRPNEMVGFLVDTVMSRPVLPLATYGGAAKGVAAMTIADLLSRVQEQVLEGLPHQHVAPSEACKALGLPPPGELFNTLINFRKFDVSAHDKGRDGDTEGPQNAGLGFKPISIRDPMPYDVVVALSELEEGLHVTLSWWDSEVQERHAAMATACIEAVIDMMLEGRDRHLTCASVFSGLKARGLAFS
ncbi:hypothetical protein GQ53DRAFT_754080 [Thozetella sp. PMI_491]|nr:hypothetical protein GQ53DRAFT_754080 [Thozetella sp. PMI_491]